LLQFTPSQTRTVITSEPVALPPSGTSFVERPQERPPTQPSYWPGMTWRRPRQNTAVQFAFRGGTGMVTGSKYMLQATTPANFNA